MNKSFLNIAAGKIGPIEYEKGQGNFLVQLDKMYFSGTGPNMVEAEHSAWFKSQTGETVWCAHDVFDFLANYKYQFDHISCYRFLEHVTKSDIQGFIYLLSTAIKVGGIVDIIVPNFEILARLILDENLAGVRHSDWERHDTLVTYEMLNEPSMPHASIWTVPRLLYFVQLEQRFKFESIKEDYDFDGRQIYIRGKFKRVK